MYAHVFFEICIKVYTNTLYPLMILGIVYWGYARSLSNFNGAARPKVQHAEMVAQQAEEHTMKCLRWELNRGPGSVKKGQFGVWTLVHDVENYGVDTVQTIGTYGFPNN